MSQIDKSRPSLAELDPALAELVGEDLLMACGILVDGRNRWRERAEAAEAQRDELQKRIGYTAVPHDSQCESPPEVD